MTPIDISEKSGVRYLHFGSEWIQGAMRVARPFSLELEYTREMMLPLLMYPHDWPKRVLLIGLGAGSLLKFLWRYRRQAQLTVVEIDPRIEAAARQFFKLPDDPERINIRIADGADFVAVSKQKFDLILVDGFDARARANRLDSVPFYLNCKSHLADEGMLCVNLLSRRRDYAASKKRLLEAFDGHTIVFPSNDAGNAIALSVLNGGGAGVSQSTALRLQSGSAVQSRHCTPAPTGEELADAARALHQDTGLNLLPQLSRIASAGCLTGGALRI